MNAPFHQIRQVAQYPRQDAAVPGTVVLMQMGEAGTPYASITAAGLVTSALAAGGDLNLSAANGAVNFLLDQGAGSVGLSVAQGELLVTPALRTSTLNAAFVNSLGVTVNGVAVATQADLAADRAASVTSFNLRTGDIMLMTEDILRAGGAPIRDAHFGGWITAPSVWDTRANDDTVATTNWVHRAIHDFGVSSFNGRTGDIVLTTADINAATAAGPGYPTAPSPVLGDASNRIATTLFVDESLQDLHLTISNEQLALLTSTYAPINSAALTGIPTAPTANPGTHTGQLATTAFVMNAVTASTSGVSSFNTRTGAVTLQATDISGASGALLNSPAFVGAPTAPTAAPGTNNTSLATTAFVAAAITTAGGVTSFNTRTGAVVLSLADVTGTGVLSNTGLTGVPTAPTATAGTSTTQIATTAFVAAALASGVTSFMSRTGAVTLTSADVSSAGGALNASPVFTGTPTAPTAAPGTNSTQLATTAFVAAALAATGVTTFNGRAGAVTLTSADITGAGGALLASPTFTGTPAAPTATAGTNTTQLATTAFVQAILASPVFTGNMTLSSVWVFDAPGGIPRIISVAPAGGSYFRNSGSGSVTFQNGGGGGLLQVSDSTLSNANPGCYLQTINGVIAAPAVAQIATSGASPNRSIQLVPNGTGTVSAPTMPAGDNSTAIATTAFVAATVPVLRSYLAGLGLSTAGASATFAVAPGVAADQTNARMMNLAASISKTTAAWAVGNNNGALDTGAVAANTWYHVHLIERTDTGVVDVLVSLSPTAPTMPSPYTLFRRIGSMKTNASSQWIKFLQTGDLFEWDVPVGDVSGATVAVSANVLQTLSVPPGVKTQAIFYVQGSATVNGLTLAIWDPDITGSTALSLVLLSPVNSACAASAVTRIMTNASAQIRYANASASFTWTSFAIDTFGWVDRRGRDA